MLGGFVRGRWRSNAFVLVLLAFLMYALYRWGNENEGDTNSTGNGKYKQHRHALVDNSTQHNAIQDYDTIEAHDKVPPPETLKESEGKQECTPPVIAHSDLKTSDLWGKAWNGEKLQSALTPHNVHGPLKVFVIVHSHVDPGWLKTFDRYYSEEVVKILDNMLKFMDDHPNMKYIWSEISFLEKWWHTLDDARKERLKRLLSNGQLEITGGPWVMTDEATTHYWATVDNLIEGHHFLHNTLNILPNVSWTVDPFGHGTTVPYLCALSNIRHHVIGRLFSTFKSMFRESQNLVINWRQLWDVSGKFDVLTQILPYFTYVTADNCGPIRRECQKYDFGPGAAIFRAGGPSRVVDGTLVERYAEDLAKNYKGLSKFYKHPVIMVPHGADFGLQSEIDWKDIHDSYSAIFEKMKQYGVEAQFGTLSNYFNELEKHTGTDLAKSSLSVLSGDFFPYLSGSNNKDHWTGYYSTRPFYKRRERELSSHIRSTDAMALNAARGMDGQHRPVFMQWVYDTLKQARRDLALFQHHDAITGTSRQNVMDDYAKKLLTAWKSVDIVQSVCITILTQQNDKLDFKDFKNLLPNWKQVLYLPDDALKNLMPHTITVENIRYIAIENSLAQSRKHVHRLILNSANVEVTHKGKPLPMQINPVIERISINVHKFELVFIAPLDPLSISIFELQPSESSVHAERWAKISVGSKMLESRLPTQLFRTEIVDQWYLSNNDGLNTTHATNGLMQTLNMNGESHKVEHTLGLLDSSSGAYLISFPPPTTPTIQQIEDFTGSGTETGLVVYKIDGPIVSELYIQSSMVGLKYTVVKTNDSQFHGVFVQMRPDLNGDKYKGRRTGVELMSTFSTHIASHLPGGNQFYTDTNCLHLVRRRMLDRIPLSANFYPMSCAVVVQSSSHRFNIITGQPHAVTSMERGEVNMVIDRLGSRNEGLGLSEGVTTSPPSILNYFMTIEPLEKSQEKESEELAYLSMHVHFALQSLLNTPVAFTYHAPVDQNLLMQADLSLLGSAPCDFILLSCRALSQSQFLLILQRVPIQCLRVSNDNTVSDNNQDSDTEPLMCTNRSYEDFFESFNNWLGRPKLVETSLTGSSVLKEQVDLSDGMTLAPRQIISFKINY